MNLRDVTPDKWIRYCKDCELSSVYLDPRWLELIESVYPKLKIHRLVCRDAPDKIRWLLPLVEIKPLGRKRPMLISLPFGNYGGVILPKGRADRLTGHDMVPLVNYFDESNASVLELRETEKPEYRFHIQNHFKRFEITFPEKPENLWGKFITGNARTSVRKADKFNLETVSDYPNAFGIFQKLYERNASYHGTPIHAVNWYERLMTLFESETEVVLARCKGSFIGALLILHYQGKSILHAAVTDPGYRKIPITDKLIWSTFEGIILKKRTKSFDFGRTRPDPGKLFFKRKWGGLELPIYYSYLVKPGQKIPRITPENPAFKPAIWVWSRLPMPVKRSLGPFFRSRIPT
jgi:Acetyltransferase (GNAT) domain